MKQCIDPASIQDWELEAYLDGASSPRISQHLAQCEFCQARLTQLRRFSQVLTTALYRQDCPGIDELRALRWKQLSPTRAALVRQHLATSAACAQEIATFDGPTPEANETGAGWLERAFSVFVARLAPPSLTPLPALRGNAVADIIYEVQEKGWEVTITAITETRGYSLAGQVMGPDPEELSPARATLLAGDRLIQEVGLDATGWFELRGLSACDYDLWVEFSTARIQIPELHLGAPLPSGEQPPDQP